MKVTKQKLVLMGKKAVAVVAKMTGKEGFLSHDD